MLSFNPVRFISAKEAADKQPATASNASLPQLSGPETAAFYEATVATPSSQPPSAAQPPKAAPKRQPSRKAKAAPPRPRLPALFRAAQEGDLEGLLRCLAAHPVDAADAHGWTPLHCAAFAGHGEVVRTLVARGAHAFRRNPKGQTAADLAASQGFFDVARQLAAGRPAEPEQPGPSQSSRSWHCSACERSVSDPAHEASTAHLLALGREPDSRPSFVIQAPNRGYQLMLRGGWEEGGLGRRGEGRRYPVPTALRKDRRCLGGEDKVRKRVTHFAAGDVGAVERQAPRVQGLRLTRRQRDAQERRDRAVAANFRRQFHDND